MSESTNPESWTAYQKLVLAELKRLDGNDQQLFDRLGKIDVEIGKLQIRAGVWGALAGAVPAVGLLLWTLLR